MELKWLEDFVALAETGSFSRAAELRHVTQPALSRRVRQLENWLGTTLVSRASLPAELTREGLRFLPQARDMIRQLYGAREAFRGDAAAKLVRFAALHTLAVAFFPNWMATLSRDAPPIRTAILPDRGGIEANLSALVEEEADFFLTYAHRYVSLRLEEGKFEFLKVSSDEAIPVTARELVVDGMKWTGEGLLDAALARPIAVPYATYGDDSFFGLVLRRLFDVSPPFERVTVHQNAIAHGLKAVVLAGGGLCWLPRSLIRTELATGALVPASRDPRWNLDIDIRLYRHMDEGRGDVGRLWDCARRNANTGAPEAPSPAATTPSGRQESVWNQPADKK
ncbi:LysR family transcriptional regulator [Novacetimonas cocois]|uniref:LysR family transcriptional regulator n=1 Tax=Novacetimonas cocois TaxID=1747507 RepID=A0A365YWD5_9PROT|nr:LysR family transcriptional regulator [Novacetimonas cocois]RBM07042.1 LysR family transcriptional regulator [Novacetimonas cocois]